MLPVASHPPTGACDLYYLVSTPGAQRKWRETGESTKIRPSIFCCNPDSPSQNQSSSNAREARSNKMSFIFFPPVLLPFLLFVQGTRADAFVRLESDRGDYIGGGAIQTFVNVEYGCPSPANANLACLSAGGFYFRFETINNAPFGLGV